MIFFYDVLWFLNYYVNFQSFYKSRVSSEISSCYQSIYLIRSLVGIDGLHISQCPHNIILMEQSISSTHLSTPFTDFSSSLSYPSFGQSYLCHICLLIFIKSCNSPNEKKHCLNITHYLNKFLLNQLEAYVVLIVPAIDFPNCFLSRVYFIAVS